MRTVEVEIKGTFQDVGIVLTRMAMVLSVTGITHGSSEQTMDDNGIMVERLTIGANETPGGADEYEFSLDENRNDYLDLQDGVRGLVLHLESLEQVGVLKPDTALMRELKVFRSKLAEYLDSITPDD